KVVTTENQVKVIGYTDFPTRLPTQSSQIYGTNLVNLLKLLCKEKEVIIQELKMYQDNCVFLQMLRHAQ
ncbi:MAG: hypothetical protein ACFNPZ_07135, partial [Fusobacterium polymorphum]